MSKQNMVQEESYVDLKILECSRQSSVEVDGGNVSNNSLFMNKLEEGVSLKVGDQISVHSAIISEIGAGGNTIELKGNVIGQTLSDRITSESKINDNDYYDNLGYKSVLNRSDAVTINSSRLLLDVRDNGVNMTLQYFKSLNGENCFSLPRRFAYNASVDSFVYMEGHDSKEQGATVFSQTAGTIVEADYYRDRNASSIFNASFLTNREIKKVRQDGTKYTLFVRFGTTYFNASMTSISPDVAGGINGNGSIDPALDSYIPYREMKQIEIPKGRRSADFIAESFSRQLLNGSDYDTYEIWNGSSPDTPEIYDQAGVITGLYNTDTFKPFNCANGSTFSRTNFNAAMAYNGNPDPTPTVPQTVLDWYNSYQYVAFKRPEFVESGRRDWNNDFSGIISYYISSISHDEIADSTKVTIEFNEDYEQYTCETLATWIKTQELYPEFWDFRNNLSPYHKVNFNETTTQNLLAGPFAIGGDTIQFNVQVTPSTKIILGKYDTITVTNPTHPLQPAVCNVIEITDNGSTIQEIKIDGKTSASVTPVGSTFVFSITRHGVLQKMTSDNSRFLHVDMVNTYETPKVNDSRAARLTFGSDMYEDATSPVTNDTTLKNRASCPLFFTYIKEQENTFFVNPEYTDDNKRLSFGCFSRGSTGKIQMITETVGGIPKDYYNASGFFIGSITAQTTVGIGDKGKRYIGYDAHFSAYGNAAVGIYGRSNFETVLDQLTPGLQELDTKGVVTAKKNEELLSTINQTYMGAINPQLTYDPQKDRFGFSDFYTPEFGGNNAGAGNDGDLNPVRDGKDRVYKINKRLRQQNYAPGMAPYTHPVSIDVVKDINGKRSNASVAIDFPNKNIFPFSVMDSHSGIMIDTFGMGEDLWNQSLLGILGFSYNQLQSPLTKDNLTSKRINTFNISKLNTVTTQAQIASEDLMISNQNIYGAIMYKTNINSNFILHHSSTNGSPPVTTKETTQYNSPVNIGSDSLIVTAESVPRQMLNPFYTIRSDLIDDTSYLGSRDSGIKLPVIAVISKSTTGGDFFIQESSLTFTVTKPKVVTSVISSIHDPDGSFARVDDNSAIIYKIQKNQSYPSNLLAMFGM